MERAMEGVGVGRSNGRLALLRGLLWVEWLRSWNLLFWFFAVWTAGLWVLPIFFHPGNFLGLGTLYVAIVAQLVAGRDAFDGAVEFNLSLPPTRGQMYLARALFAGLPLIVFLGVGLLAVRFEWPQAVSSLLVESGFTEPVIHHASSAWFGSALAIPLVHFACTFALGSLARSAPFASVVWIVGLLATLSVAAPAWLLEGAVWGKVNGYISVPILLAAAPAVLALGYWLYLRRDVAGEAAPGGALARTWAWLAAVAILFLLLAGLLFATVASYRNAAMQAERARALQAAVRAQMEAQIRVERERERETETEDTNQIPKEK